MVRPIGYVVTQPPKLLSSCKGTYFLHLGVTYFLASSIVIVKFVVDCSRRRLVALTHIGGATFGDFDLVVLIRSKSSTLRKSLGLTLVVCMW